MPSSSDDDGSTTAALQMAIGAFQRSAKLQMLKHRHATPSLKSQQRKKQRASQRPART